jgi:putative ABC transport system substrate-binding protein
VRQQVALIALLFGAAPALANPGQPGTAHIGILTTLPLSNPVSTRLWTALTDALQQHGWVKGQSLTVTYRFSEGIDAVYPQLAAELIDAHPDLIVADGPLAVKEVEEQSKTVPIVMWGVPNPVQLGFIASLAHPGGNITGVSTATEDVLGKGMQLLTQMRPGMRRITYLGYGAPQYWQGTTELATAAARRLGVSLKLIPLTAPADFVPALATVAKDEPDALIVSSVPLFFAQTPKLAAFAIAHRLPAMTFAPLMVRGGLLMAYHADFADEVKILATVVDKILRGAKPADIPVEEPDKFGLILNLKTAHAIGLAVPPELRDRADEVIE